MVINSENIVGVISAVASIITGVYLAVISMRDKTVQKEKELNEKQRLAFEEMNKLLMDDMKRSVEFNKSEVAIIREQMTREIEFNRLEVQKRDERIAHLENQINTIQNDCQARSLELIKSLNLKEAQLQKADKAKALWEAEKVKTEEYRAKSKLEIESLNAHIADLQSQIESIKKKLKKY